MHPDIAADVDRHAAAYTARQQDRAVHLSVDREWPDLGDEGLSCCAGAAMFGPGRCTCWEPVYDHVQQAPRTDVVPGCQERPCHDCAYLPGSPEKSGDDRYSGDAAMLERLVVDGQPFWCHQGIRQLVEHRHPTGAVAPAPPGAYNPPIVEGVPYQADGTPALLCAGWAARRLAWLQRGTR